MNKDEMSPFQRKAENFETKANINKGTIFKCTPTTRSPANQLGEQENKTIVYGQTMQ